MADEALGPIIRRHPVDNARRGRLALILLGLGLVAVIVATTLILLLQSRSRPQQAVDPYAAPIFVLGCGLGALIGGGWLAWLYRSRAGEVFEVHEGGIVHRYGDQARAARWDSVKKVVNTGKSNAFTRVLGGDVSCRITFTDDTPAMTFTGLTQDALELFTTARQHHSP
jgi:hypothetical protein